MVEEIQTLRVVPSIKNGSFEEGSSSPTHWQPWKYKQDVSTCEWESGAGLNGSKCISITSMAANFAAWRQDLNISKRTQAYNVRGVIKGEGITGGEGANIGIEDTWDHSPGEKGTFDWKETVFTFMTDGSKKTEIGCRLGYWSNDSMGTAWFDDIVLEDVFVRWPSNHFEVFLERDDAAVMTENTRQRWLSHLDATYEIIGDLTGHHPYNGDKIGILSVRQYPGGLAVAGNPIKWTRSYIKNDIQRANEDDDWIFAIIHEIGHDFDIDAWNFEAEHNANFKLYYAVAMLNGKVYLNGNWYSGEELKQFYLSRYSEYKQTGTPNNDCVTYCFIDLAEQVGWDTVKRAFHSIKAMDPQQIPVDRIDKFNMFLDMWIDHQGVSVREKIAADDLQNFEHYLKTLP